MSDNNIIYEDNLIRIKGDTIILKHYYFPFISKVIGFENIKNIDMVKISSFETVLFFPLFPWRVYGLGFINKRMTLFPFDFMRSMRDIAFIIDYKYQKMKSGFTVEDSETVERIIMEKERLIRIFS